MKTSIEVFKTNVVQPYYAHFLITQIHELYPHYSANFDLQDSDHILRVECKSGEVSSGLVICLVSGFGFHAEVLPDEIPAVKAIYEMLE